MNIIVSMAAEIAIPTYLPAAFEISRSFCALSRRMFRLGMTACGALPCSYIVT